MAERVARRRRRGEGRRIRLDVRVDEAEHRGLVERAGARGVSIARLMIDAALESAQWEWPETAPPGDVEGGGEVARRRPRSEARPIRLEVRVNAAEHRDLSERARERGVSVARLMVDAARGVPPLPAARHVVSAEVQEQFAQLDATWHRAGCDVEGPELAGREQPQPAGAHRERDAGHARVRAAQRGARGDGGAAARDDPGRLGVA